MKQKDKQKYQRYHNQSLMALGTSGNGVDPLTKKNIELEQIFSSVPVAQNNNRVYVFKLPYHTEISMLVSALTTRFLSSVIHAEEDDNGAQIILEGLKCPGMRGKIAKVMDYFVFCCSKGLHFGRLEETYNVILLTIRKHVIQNTCQVTVTNPYYHLKNNLPEIFKETILFSMQEEIKIILKTEELERYDDFYLNPTLSESSPTKMDINIHKKIYDLFVLSENKDYNRYKNIFFHEMEKIVQCVDNYRQKVNNPNIPVKRLPSPSQITEIIIKQSQTLLQSLKNSYQEQDKNEMNYLHSLLSSQTAQIITLYTIEQTICMYQLINLKEIYYSSLQEQCEAFNKHMEEINLGKSDQECFQHLTLKKKYRLPREQRPYYSAIMRFRQIQHCNSLREGLLVIQQTFSDVKTDCYVSHKGKLELSSMDQLLPVVIFVTVRAAVRNMPIWINLIGDYVRMRSVFELEERIMTAFYAAIEDVSRGWEEKESTQST